MATIVAITQDTKDIFRNMLVCGIDNCMCYVVAKVIDKETFDLLAELVQKDFVEDLEFAMAIKDKKTISKILKSYADARTVHSLLKI